MKKLAGIATCLVAAVAIAQQPYLETFEVRLHNLEVVVTDRAGQPVRGLTKEDFLVYESGVLQNVTNFSIYDSATSTVSSVNANAASSAAPTFVQEPVQERPAPPRHVLFFVDDMTVLTPSRKKLLKQATSFVDQLQPGDLASVVRPTGEKRIAQDYTTDHAAVRASLTEAIESLKMRPNAPDTLELRDLIHGMERASNDMERDYAKALYTVRGRDRVRQRLEQLRAWIGSTAGVEGRKVLVLITSGISAHPGRDVVDPEAQMVGHVSDFVAALGKLEDLNPAIDELARTAAANGVTIYAIEPEEPLTIVTEQITSTSQTEGTTIGGAMAQRLMSPERQRASMQSRTKAITAVPFATHLSGVRNLPREMFTELQTYKGQTLTSLTEKTGGRWFRGPGVIDDVFRQISADLSSYYSIAYRATQQSEKARRVEVKIRNRPELKVRTRSEVIDKTPEKEMGDLVLSGLLVPRRNNELRIAATAGVPTKQRYAFSVPIDIVMPLDAMTFVQQPDGQYLANLDVHFAVTGNRESFTMSGRHQQRVAITPQQYANRAGVTFRFKSSVEVARGQMKLSLGVMDAASRLTGFQVVEVNAQ